MSETRPAVDVFEKARSHDRLEQLEAAREQDLLPYFRLIESEAGPLMEVEGSEKVMLGSNNYLGLTGDERVKQAARDALERYGTGLTGSRFLNGTTPLHAELERELAEWMGSEDVIVFTTGHQANVGCLGTILGPSDTVICDSGDHASILDGVKISGAKLRPFRHNQMPKLERMLERAADDGGGVLVVVDGVFSMEGDLCDLPVDRRALPALRRAAHGRRGARGRRARRAGRRRLRAVRARGPGRPADGHLLEEPCLVRRVHRRLGRGDRFPADHFAAVHLHRVGGAGRGRRRARRAAGDPLGGTRADGRLLGNSAYLRQGFRDLGLQVIDPGRLPDGTEANTPVVPVMVGEDWQAVLLWKALFDAGVYTNVALHPAVPPGGALLRTSLMATHEREHLDRALGVFERVLGDFPDVPRSG